MGRDFDIALGKKIKSLREQLGLTLEQVAERLGFNSYQILSAIEGGTRTLKAAELTQISKVFHKDISFFLTGDSTPSSNFLVRWRCSSNSSGIKEKEAEFLLYCDNYYDLERRLGLNHKCSLDSLNFDHSDLKNYSKINQIAQEKVLQLQLGSRPACILRKILEDKYNVKIFHLDLNSFGSAASANGDFGAAMLINASESEGRRNFDLAHEFFHIITWDKFQGVDFSFGGRYYEDLETTADSFASALLMPETEIRNEFSKRLKDDGKIALVDLVGMAHEFVVSIDALLWRLVNLGLLSKEPVKKLLTDHRPQLNAIKAFSGLKSNEQECLLSKNYVHLSFKAFKMGLISKSRLATYLKVNVGDVAQALSRFGYRVEDDYNEELVASGR